MTLTSTPRHRAASDAALPLAALAGFATVDVREPAGQQPRIPSGEGQGLAFRLADESSKVRKNIQWRRASGRRQVGPEVGPTAAFYGCNPTGMRGPTCFFWASLTPFLLKVYLSSHAEGWEQTAAALAVAAENEQRSLDAHGPKSEVVGAIRAAVMWNSVRAGLLPRRFVLSPCARAAAAACHQSYGFMIGLCSWYAVWLTCSGRASSQKRLSDL
jgi:hypothetical protein